MNIDKSKNKSEGSNPLDRVSIEVDKTVSLAKAIDPLGGRSYQEDLQVRAEKSKNFSKGLGLLLGSQLGIPNRAELREMIKTTANPVRLIGLKEAGGKVRVASLHPVNEVTAGRDMTRRYLPILKGLVTTRDILKGQEICLHRTHVSKRDLPPDIGDRAGSYRLYSADLKAATDYMPHAIAQRVGRKLAEHIGLPGDKEALDMILGPHQLHSSETYKSPENPGPSKTTTRGIHMGLGVTWVVLSLVNSFCAHEAGVSKFSHAVCGDDLSGWWTDEQSDSYEHNLTRCGLVANLTKSFRSRRGVFCERIVSIDTKVGNVARSKDVGHIAGYGASKLKARFSSSPLAVADGLTNLANPLARATRKGLLPRQARAGPLNLGGKGEGVANLRMLKEAAKSGTISVSGAFKYPTKFFPKGEVEGEYKCSDLRLKGQTLVRYRNLILTGIKNTNSLPTPVEEKSGRSLHSRRSGLTKLAEPTLPEFRETVRRSNIKSKDRKTILHVLRDPRRAITPSARRWLSRLVTRERAERFVSREEARYFLGSIQGSAGVEAEGLVIDL